MTDPYDASIGLKFPKTEADVVTVSHQHSDHNAVKHIEGNPIVIDMPGDYEKNGIRITGFASYHDNKKGAERGENIVYKIESEGIHILHCGDLGLIPDEKFIDEVGEVDVLMVPVGGFYTIDSTQAVELIKKIEPSLVIPMHYNREGLNPKIFEKVAPVTEFLKQVGAEGVVPVSKLTLKKEDLQGEMKVVVMEI